MTASTRSSAPVAAPSVQALATLGQAILAQRKALGISAVAASEAAGISRVTLHRIEKGAPSVAAGAYMAALTVLGLRAELVPQDSAATVPAAAQDRKGWLPARVRIADYPQLRALAWQVRGTAELTPLEALDIYRRNWRHLDEKALTDAERDLIDALRVALGDGGAPLGGGGSGV